MFKQIKVDQYRAEINKDKFNQNVVRYMMMICVIYMECFRVEFQSYLQYEEQ